MTNYKPRCRQLQKHNIVVANITMENQQNPARNQKDTARI